MLNFDNNVIDQRGDDVLGLLAKSFEGRELSDYQWFRLSDSTAIEGQISSNLNIMDIPGAAEANDAYYVCFTINKGTDKEVRTCACAKAFSKNVPAAEFGDFTVTASYLIAGGNVFVKRHGKI